ncbi:MAG: hypothetical protein J7M26_05820 [Armatimonadetes bacterium]|nr:hypothetical protein [Armatimonadota bacterium]
MTLRHPAGDGWSGLTCQRFEVKPGEEYIVGGWVKVPAAIADHAKSRVYLRFFNRDGQFFSQAGPLLPHEKTGWVKVESRVTVPEKAAFADVSAQLWSPGGTVLLDDLFLFAAGNLGKNLLDNSSFETAGGGWRDLGHDPKYLTHDTGIGTGSFTSVENPGSFVLTDFGRSLGLGAVDWAALRQPDFVQTLDATTLPAEDEVRPLVGLGKPATVLTRQGLFPVVMIVHHCARFKGAVDVWCRGNCPPLNGRALDHVAVVGTVALLRQRGLLSQQEARAMTERSASFTRPRPKVYQPVTEKRPFDTPWPHSKHPAETIYVCDVSQALPQEEFALTVLQGLVNRELPRLYLIHSRYAKQDKQWLDELRFEGLKTQIISQQEVWRRFGSVAKGVVLYDAAIMDEIGAFHADRLNLTNIVLMLCAVNDAVPLALSATAKPPAGRKVIFDTRGRWPQPYDMYKWAYDNLWPQMNHHVLATLYPGIFYLTDYLVENRIFTFWFASQRTLPEQDLLETILASTPPNTPILGWWFCWMPRVQDPAHRAADCVGEGEGVRLGSKFGKFLTPSHEATNLSVHSGMPLLGYRHKPVANPVRLDRSKVYYSFIMSDGDNLGECLMMRRRASRWDTPERGSVPIGWSFAPATAVLAPPVLNYYLRTATPGDLLVGGLGIAYTQPDVYATAFGSLRDRIFAQYARMTADALKPLDTGALWLIGGSKENISRYAAAGRPLRTLFPDYGSGRKRPYEDVTYMDVNGVAVFRAVTGWGGNEPYADRLVRQIKEATEGVRPAFVHAFLLNWGTTMPMLQEVMRRLGPEYVCVRPDELDRLYRESLGLPPE